MAKGIMPVFAGGGGGGGGASTEVTGLIAHDDPDNEATNFPVKTGGHATTSPRPAVSADDDIADHSVDLEGRQRVRVSGIDDHGLSVDVVIDPAGGLAAGGPQPHDMVSTGYPVKTGAYATSSPRAAVSADGDIADHSADREGRHRARVSGFRAGIKDNFDTPLDDYGSLFVSGGTVHDTPADDLNYPIKIGGHAFEGVPAAVDDGDMVRAIFDLIGRQQVNHPLAIAGENQVQDWLRVHEAAAAVEQGAWLLKNANAVASLVVKASAGRLRQFAGANTNAGARYLMAFNATATPANGTAPVWVAEAGPAAASGDIARTEFDGGGLYFDAGITLAWSETALTLTLATAAEHSIFARYF